MGCTCFTLGGTIPCQWCSNPYGELASALAEGQELDKIANQWGTNRYWGETDEELRQRIIKKITNIDNAKDPGFPAESRSHSCECGAHKLGFTQRGTGHSYWCPMGDK